MKLAASMALSMTALSAAFSPVADFSPLLRLGRIQPRQEAGFSSGLCPHPSDFKRHALAQTTSSSTIRWLASPASESGSSATTVERATEVVGSVFGGKGDEEFWEWRKQAQTGGISSLNTELTYGEFDLDLFGKLLALSGPAPGEVFLDIGSGCGRLVIFSAIAYPSLSQCRGIEVMPGLHEAAEAGLNSARAVSEELRSTLGSERVVLALGDVYEEPSRLHDVDVCFCYSTAYDSIGSQLTQLSACLGCNLRVGSRVITTDKELASDGPWAFELLHKLEGKNSDVGRSTGFVWRVVKSPLI